MGKQFKGQRCTYCLENPSIPTGDHIFAREFFLQDQRSNLPKVPACERCNGDKSRLEHYLTAVLPFGGRHSDASANLQNMVPKRLAENRRLHRELAQGFERTILPVPSGDIFPSVTIPFDGSILESLFTFIVRGSLFFHWGITLGDRHGVRGISLTPTGQYVFSLFLKMNARQRVNISLGGGTFRYEAAQGNIPELTVWRFSIYGGLIMAGDRQAPHEIATGLGAVTGTKEFLGRPALANMFAYE